MTLSEMAVVGVQPEIETNVSRERGNEIRPSSNETRVGGGNVVTEIRLYRGVMIMQDLRRLFSNPPERFPSQ